MNEKVERVYKQQDLTFGVYYAKARFKSILIGHRFPTPTKSKITYLN